MVIMIMTTDFAVSMGQCIPHVHTQNYAHNSGFKKNACVIFENQCVNKSCNQSSKTTNHGWAETFIRKMEKNGTKDKEKYTQIVEIARKV